MKKYCKQLICALLLLCLVAGFAPATAEAATIRGDARIHNLQQKKWITKPDSEKYDDYYRFKITSPGYIKIWLDKRKVSRRSSQAAVFIYKTYNDMSRDNYYIRVNDDDEVNCFALPKGTYYLYSNSSKMRFKYQFVDVARGSNYCKAKATTIRAAKSRTLVFDYGYEFTKWYKIKLTEEHKIRIYLEAKEHYSDPEMMLLTSKGEEILTTDLSDTLKETEELPAGIYYIKVSRRDGNDDARHKYADGYVVGRVVGFSWNQY